MPVLVADDAGTIRMLIRRALKTLKVYDIVEATDGIEAVEKFKSNPFDLVVLDWNMPGKTGRQVTSEIRARDAVVPVLMVTGKAERADVLEAIRAGVTDYLLKPFSPGSLEAKLLALLPLEA